MGLYPSREFDVSLGDASVRASHNSISYFLHRNQLSLLQFLFRFYNRVISEARPCERVYYHGADPDGRLFDSEAAEQSVHSRLGGAVSGSHPEAHLARD